MIQEIHARTAPEAYVEALWKMQVCGEKSDSRNGPVLSIPYPVVLEIQEPTHRFLFDPIRDANPFFHIMEFCWMMAGSNDAEWLSMFNKRMMDYADDGVLGGAYGYRWVNPVDQLEEVIALLKKEPDTRQAVISMWDPYLDGPNARNSDRPCNTHIYFRVNKHDELDMTVCNRSNDLIWGMLGSNVVHFTMLHELVSRAAGYYQGLYRVFTNNLHVYTEMPKFEEIFNHRALHDPYRTDEVSPQKLLWGDETWVDFREDCVRLVEGSLLEGWGFKTRWMNTVGINVHDAYIFKENRDLCVGKILASDIGRACTEWCDRRKS